MYNWCHNRERIEKVTKYEPVKVVGLNNDTINIVGDFIEGGGFDISLCEKMMRTFDVMGEHKSDYLTTVKMAKSFLDTHVPDYLNDVCVIDGKGVELSSTMRAVMVRVINLAHKGRYNVVLDEEVIYVAPRYRKHSPEDFWRYIKLTLLDFKDASKSKTVRRLKRDARLIASEVTKTVVSA